MRRPRAGRSGVALRVATDIVSRYQDIRAVWFAVHNDPNQMVGTLSAEFYFIVGQIMEGQPLHAIKFNRIDRARVLTHAEE